MADDYYGILGVTRDATSQDIKRAFREIARRCHPDVAGADGVAEERFKSARKAYETLMDPVARARYDRRGQRKAPPPGGSFFDAFYRSTDRAASSAAGRMRSPPPGGGTGPGGGRTGPGGSAWRNPGNSVTLDDLMGDFGFGEARASGRAAPPGPEARSRVAPPELGEDVRIELEVPADVARAGGSLTAVYYRMQRADSWRPGASDPGLVRVQDIADIRVLPGTRTGDQLRERGLGCAGAHGGPYGDLLVSVRVAPVRTERSVPPPPPPPRRAHTADPVPDPPPEPTGADPSVDLTIVEAILGGRVSLDTPQGRVRLTIPPGTSSGVRLRLKGRGPVDSAGQPTDWFVVTRIVAPKDLDPESRRLIEEFARLNPSATE